MIARAIPLKIDSITFKNCAHDGSGANLTSGVAFSDLYSAVFIRLTSLLNSLESCHDAESHEKYMRSLACIL